MKVTFTNFRCFRDAYLRLSELTVILGPNASGKSAIVQALNPTFCPSAIDVWQRRTGLSAQIRLKLDSGIESTATYHIDGRQKPHRQHFEYQGLQMDVRSLRAANELTSQTRLSQTGDNLTNVFGSMSRAARTELAAEFCRLVPVFADVDNLPAGAGHHRLMFQDKWNSAVWYEPKDVSDGTMLVLAFLVLQHQSPPVEVLAIEDPERGLHPYLIGEVIQTLRKMATGEVGKRKLRIVLVTHSPILLEHVQPEEVRFLNRTDDGSVEITEAPLDSVQWQHAYEEYGRSLSNIWLSGGIGGVPGS